MARNNTAAAAVYILLLCLRLLCVVLPGYVHPDEFFQSGQELLFGACHQPSSSSNTYSNIGVAPSVSLYEYTDKQGRAVPLAATWEFHPQNAVRSIAPPLFLTALPLRIYVALRRTFKNTFSNNGDGNDGECIEEKATNHLSWAEHLSGFEILVIPRIFLMLLSVLAVDYPCCILAKRFSRHRNGSFPYTELFVLSTSWPSLVFLCRPFTNTLETLILSVLLVVVSGDWVSVGDESILFDGTFRSITIGLLSSVGVFNRFTFAFYAFPAVAMYLLKKSTSLRKTIDFYQVLKHIFLVSIGFLVSSLGFVALDTTFYSGLKCVSGCTIDSNDQISSQGIKSYHRYIAPLNFLMYNLNTNNLDDHGLHPRITHLAINLPMLFGPMAIGLYAAVGCGFLGLFIDRRSRKNSYNAVQDMDKDGSILCQIVIISGVLILSSAPHQEPRFLLPVTVPLVLLQGRHTQQHSSSRRFWVLFNAALFVFYGFLHQGGVLPSLLSSNEVVDIENIETDVSTRMGSKATFIFQKTYMPPSFASLPRAFDKDAYSQCGSFDLLDLQGSGIDTLEKAIDEMLDCTVGGSRRSKIFVVMPSSVWEDSLATRMDENQIHFNSIYSYKPHITTEDMPQWTGNLPEYANKMAITIYSVTCAQQGQ